MGPRRAVASALAQEVARRSLIKPFYVGASTHLEWGLRLIRSRFPLNGVYKGYYKGSMI